VPTPDRRARLLALLQGAGRASVGDLANGLGVTAATVRRDLQVLAREGKLLRTYGGATLADRRPVRDAQGLEAKRAIGAVASLLVTDGSTIAIGSGTTALELARRLVDRRITVITNALDVANELVDRAGIELILLGGAVRPRMHSMLGHLAEMATAELRADTLFMGIGAISIEHGLMNDSIPEILTDRALRRMARSVVVLADASKFEQVAAAYVFGLDEVDTIVTDWTLPAESVQAIEARGVRVIIAGPEPAGVA
jgi:DeoR/GlpR family transcriptional regulator of sugar metabolism